MFDAKNKAAQLRGQNERTCIERSHKEPKEKARNRNARTHTSKVGVLGRICDLILGCPSASRAYGGYAGYETNTASRTSAVKDAGSDVPIYEIDRSFASDSLKLPKIWISEAVVCEGSADVPRRRFVASYPNGPDAGGRKAYELSQIMMGEAFNSSVGTNTSRQGCFQAAEILLLHAVEKKNVQACIKLGDIYYYDLCKGDYWSSNLEIRAKHARKLDERALLKRAWIHYAAAAKGASAYAYIQLGEILAKDKDAESAKRSFACYVRAMELSCGKDPCSKEGLIEHDIDRFSHCFSLLDGCDLENLRDFGIAALKVAECLERGRGCKRQLDAAKELFNIAYLCLERAFGLGCWHNKKDMLKAISGFKRVSQELRLTFEMIDRAA